MLVAVDAAVVLKEQGNAPERRKSDQSVYYTADRCCLSAAYPSHDVEAEQSDTAPVDTADDAQNKSDPVYDHHI